MKADELAAREVTDPYCLADGAAAALLAGAPWRRFVVLGDSVAEGVSEALDGYRSPPWADRVAAVLTAEQPELAYLNLGRRDTPTAAVRGEQLGRALAFRPDLAGVTCGGADMLRRSFDFQAVEAELARIVSALQAQGCLVFTMGLFDLSRSPYLPDEFRKPIGDKLRLLSERTAIVAMRHGAVHVDLTSHPAAGEDIWSSDGRHVNARGHAIAAAETIRRLGVHLGNAAD